jgi:hypothetical protein
MGDLLLSLPSPLPLPAVILNGGPAATPPYAVILNGSPAAALRRHPERSEGPLYFVFAFSLNKKTP